MNDSKELKVQASTKTRDLEAEEKKKQELLDNPDKVKPFITTKKQRRATKDEYYVDPEEFSRRLQEYYETEDETGENYQELGKIFIKIANGLASSQSFSGYTWKSDMIGEALLKMTKALKGKKFSFGYNSKPFSYFTQIAFWAFVGKRKEEMKQHEIHNRYRQIKYADSFRECEDTKNIYIRPEFDGDIFGDGNAESDY